MNSEKPAEPIPRPLEKAGTSTMFWFQIFFYGRNGNCFVLFWMVRDAECLIL